MAIRKRFLFFSNKKGSESQENQKKKKRQRRYDAKEIEEMAPPFCCESNVGRFGKHSQVLKPKKKQKKEGNGQSADFYGGTRSLDQLSRSS